MKAMIASVKQMENRLSSVVNKKRLIEKSDEKLIRKYGEKNAVVGSIVGK